MSKFKITEPILRRESLELMASSLEIWFSNLCAQFNKGDNRSVITVGSNYTITSNNEVILANSASANIEITLPGVEPYDGFIFTIKKTSASNVVTLIGTVEGVVNPTLNANYEYKVLIASNELSEYISVGG